MASKYNTKIMLSVIVIVKVTAIIRTKIIIKVPIIREIIVEIDNIQIKIVIQQHPNGEPIINNNTIKNKIQQQNNSVDIIILFRPHHFPKIY